MSESNNDGAEIVHLGAARRGVAHRVFKYKFTLCSDGLVEFKIPSKTIGVETFLLDTKDLSQLTQDLGKCKRDAESLASFRRGAHLWRFTKHGDGFIVRHADKERPFVTIKTRKELFCWVCHVLRRAGDTMLRQADKPSDWPHSWWICGSSLRVCMDCVNSNLLEPQVEDHG